MSKDPLVVMAIGLENTSLVDVKTACHRRYPGLKLVSYKDKERIADAIQEISPDIIVLDLSIDEYGSFPFLKHIRRHTHAPLIAISYTTSVSRTIKTLEAGADRLMLKPINKMEMVTHIDSFLHTPKY